MIETLETLDKPLDFTAKQRKNGIAEKRREFISDYDCPPSVKKSEVEEFDLPKTTQNNFRNCECCQ